MNVESIISNLNNKKELTKEEIYFFVNEYTKGNISDEDATKVIKIIYDKGLSKREISDLTLAMANSGKILDLSDISDNIIDKHSTGGVGDKITIILMPIIASIGIPVAKMSGRGLGFTGGTADKLESIPGYKVDISIEEFKRNVKEIGISLITSSKDLAPADKKIYALRDKIGCTDSIPLIASSIMSKKIAAGANKIVIDLTYGSGAFMKNEKDAIKLAKTMIDIGKEVNREVRCVITNMNEPVGYTVGNQLEIKEVVESLKNNMRPDVEEIVYALGEEIILMANKTDKRDEARNMIRNSLETGKAFEKFKELVIKQGGDISYIDDLSKFEESKYVVPVISKKSGYVSKIMNENIGRASLLLGAGRAGENEDIDFKAGLIVNKKIGEKVKKGDTLIYIHTDKKNVIEDATRIIMDSYSFSLFKKTPRKTVLSTIK